MNKSIRGLVIAPVLLGFLLTTGMSLAEDKDKKTTKNSEKKVAGKKAKKVRKKPRGRLPAYFKDIVNDSQKEKIYSIQKKYSAELNALRAKLRSLTKERNEAVKAVLTPSQQEKLTKAIAAAREKRKKGRDKSTKKKDTKKKESKKK